MTDAAPSPVPPPSPTPVNSPWSDERQFAFLVYILLLAGCITGGVSAIVGVVFAYVNRETAPDWLKSHYTFQIRTFWMTLIGLIIASALVLVFIGVLLWVALFVLFVVRCALGLSRLLRSEPYPNPETWTV
ncbi:MAG: DUF4870 family protein [Caulobacterales bacterium]